jgi:hypothetical protein
MQRAWMPYAISATIVLASAAWLLWIGREPICKCGYVKLWHGQTMSSENSQHIADWYTLSHIVHGILFYWALWFFLPRVSVHWRFAIATGIETAWELIENSNWVIERYRAVTISLDYYGDSVLNAVSDILAMMIGFWLARLVPVWLSVSIVVGLEVLAAIVIRDGLCLNVLMLIWPLEAVREWQSGA